MAYRPIFFLPRCEGLSRRGDEDDEGVSNGGSQAFRSCREQVERRGECCRRSSRKVKEGRAGKGEGPAATRKLPRGALPRAFLPYILVSGWVREVAFCTTLSPPWW
ncbi:hypothetical protein E2C01_095276 [Portunus trituberculatus]|uniref:Uncharacterized protein n=1 Tax=Portunus trituberculatus TaxID=210409 RepID=A0A5B7JYZ9_PORTR|nr:hypothetical protein [Portunus trituberculatus]